MPEQKYRYEAFISYRHLPKDSYAARKIQKSIETFRIPFALRKVTGRTKFLKCFRDEDELPLAESLGDTIEDALKLSKWLIIICTPDYIGSNWCKIEREEFVRLGRKDRIIPVLVSGNAESSFPPEIMLQETSEGTIKKEPLAANCTSGTKKEFDQKFSVERYRVIAKLLGVGFDDLRRRAQRRQTATILTASAAAVAFLTAGLIYTVYQNNRVKEQRDLARKNELEMLVEKSERKTADGAMNEGLGLALTAYEQNLEYGAGYDEEVRSALEYATYPETYAKTGELDDGKRAHMAAMFSPDGKYIAVSEGYQEYAVYETTYGKQLLKGQFSERGFVYAFSGDSKRIYFAHGDEGRIYSLPDGDLEEERCLPVPEQRDGGNLWTYCILGSDGQLYPEEENPSSGSTVQSENGLTASAIDTIEGVVVTRTDTGGELWRRELNVGNTIYSFEFVNGGKQLLACNGQVTVYDAETGEILFDAGEKRTYGYCLHGDMLAIPFRDGGISFYRIPDGTVDIHRDAVPGTVEADEDYKNLTVRGTEDNSLITMENTENFCMLNSYYDEDYALHLVLEKDGKTLTLDPQRVVYTQEYGRNIDGTYGIIQQQFIPYGAWCSGDLRYQVILYPQGFVEIFEAEKQPEPVMTVYESTSQMLSAAFYGNMVALAGYETGVVFADLEKKEVLGSAGTGLMCTRMAFGPEGKRLIAFSAVESKTYLIDVASRHVIKAMDCEGKQASAVGFSADGCRAITAFPDGTALSTELYLTGEELAEAARKKLGE